MMRRIVIVLVLAALAAGGWYGYTRYAAKPANGPLVLLGNVDVREVDLSFKVAGRIDSLAVDEGAAVKPGDLMATLDKRYFNDDLAIAEARRDAQAATVAKLEHGSRPEEIAQAKANADQARATMALNKVTLDRQQDLLRTKVTSQQSVDSALAAEQQSAAQVAYAEQSLRLMEIGPRQEDIDNARAELELESGNVEVAKRSLADAELKAPTAGTILTRVREPGAIVNAGETVFTLAVASPVWVRAYVDEPNLGRVVPGMAATVTTDLAHGKLYHGHVGFISPTAEFTPKSVETPELRTDLVYRLRIIVDDPDDGLRQGMPVTATLSEAPKG